MLSWNYHYIGKVRSGGYLVAHRERGPDDQPCGHIHFCAYFEHREAAQAHADALNRDLGAAFHRPPIVHKFHPAGSEPPGGAASD